jgi:diketogulonate reductase-like aldo/keto reductase
MSSHNSITQHNLFVQCSMSIKNHDDDTIAYCQSKGIVYEAYGTMRGCPFTDPDVLAIAKEHNVSASQVCLRWVLERGCISAAGTGSSPSTVVEYAVPAPPCSTSSSCRVLRAFLRGWTCFV